MPEYLRIIVTRWRLSNHELRVETGRYVRPVLARDERTCSLCVSEVEDEEHAIYHCPLYNTVRVKYAELLGRYQLITSVFNPRNVSDACLLGMFLKDIEDIREDLNLNTCED